MLFSKKLYSWILSLLLLSTMAFATTTPPTDSSKTKIRYLDPKKVPLRELGKLPKILREASGLEFSKSRYLWSHNDDGIPALYCLDTLGALVRAVQLNITNRGWEDLTQDNRGNIYIGGFGNNRNDKKELKIYIVPNPDSIEAPLTMPQIINYTYSDQKAFPPDPTNRNYDVDAFFAWDKYLYLFTKNRSKPFKGYSKIYRLSQDPGKQTAELMDSIYVGDGPMLHNWITSADLSPDGKKLALLFHDRIWFLTNFNHGKFSKGKIYQLNLEHYSHKAGLCFKDDRTLYVVDELELDVLGGRLYTLDLKPILNEFSH